MHEKLSLYFKRFVCDLCSLLVLVSYVSVPVLADTTYYSYPNYLSNLGGDTLYGIVLNVPRVNVLICNRNNGNERRYKVIYFVWGYGASEGAAILNCNTGLGSNSSTANTGLFFGSRFSGTPGNFTYGSSVNSRSDSYNRLSGNTRIFKFFYYLEIDPNQWLTSCWAKTGTPILSTTDQGLPSYNFVNAYIDYLIDGTINSNYSFGSFTGGWVKDDTAITPAFDMSSLTTDGTQENVPPEPTAEPTSEPSPEPSSDPSQGGGTFTQTQSQSIQSGAVAFTVADGAFTNTNSYNPSVTQSIDENAVNVTVNNNNEFSPENYNDLNNLINNYNGTPGDASDPFQQAIGNFKAFGSIASAFAALASAVLGFLPWWVTGILGIVFSMMGVFTVLRLIHLFK